MNFVNYFIQDEPALFPAMSANVEHRYMSDFNNAYVIANYAYTLTNQQNSGTLDPAKSLFHYHVTPLNGMPNGMHGFILSESVPNAETIQIKVCFRGVQPADLGSVQRALEFTGPGINTFMKSSDSIFEQIEAVTKQHAAVALEFTGHSLGGADATSTFHDFFFHYLESNRFQNIEKVSLNVLNAPGNHHEIKDSLHDLLFANKHADKPLEVKINVAISDADIVSQIGESPLNDISADLATVQLCHVDKINTHNSTWGAFFKLLPDAIKETIIAHALEPLFSSDTLKIQEFSPKFDYRYYNNQTQEGFENIHATLDYKWYTVTTINFIAKCTNSVLAVTDVITGLITGDYEDYFLGIQPDASTENNHSLEYAYPASMPAIQPQLEYIADSALYIL
jgi:hypothetical protein